MISTNSILDITIKIYGPNKNIIDKIYRLIRYFIMICVEVIRNMLSYTQITLRKKQTNEIKETLVETKEE